MDKNKFSVYYVLKVCGGYMRNDIDWEYSNFFPDNCTCPPESSFSDNCIIYRYSKDNQMSDFYPQIVLNNGLIERLKSKPIMICYASGFSVFLSEEDADKNLKHLISQNKGNFSEFKHLFKSTIKQDDGKLLKTFKNNHYTFWTINGKVKNSNFTLLKDY